MERRKALAVAAAGAMLTASAAIVATTGLLRAPSHDEAGAPATTAAPTTIPPSTTEPSTTPLEPVVVTEVRDVYDTVVVPTAAPAAPAPAPGPSAPSMPATSPAPAPAGPPAPAPGSSASGSPSTTTTIPRGAEIPEDWPADKPLPPMPEDCKEPHLEDDGVWNCG